MQLQIFPTVQEVLENLAQYFVAAAQQSILERGRFTVALSGGSSPEKLYALLASPAFSNKVDWNKTYFFLGDERNVAITHPDSNFNMINRVLFKPLQINDAHVFPVNTALDPEAAARAYSQDIHFHFKQQEPRFDLVLLGLGDNSHTASLFPHTGILQSTKATVEAVFLPEQQVYRISFTAPLINLARRVAFLVYSAGKAAAVEHVLEGVRNIQLYPAQLVQPSDGEINWFLDAPAAAKLNSPA